MNSYVEKYITNETKYDSYSWIQAIHAFDAALRRWESQFESVFEIKHCVYAALHSELIRRIETRLHQLFENKKQNMILQIKKARDDKNRLKDFTKSVNSIYESESAGIKISKILIDEIKQCVEKKILREFKHYLEKCISDETLGKDLYMAAFRGAFQSDDRNAAFGFINDQAKALNNEIDMYFNDTIQQFWSKDEAIETSRFVRDRVECIQDGIDSWCQSEFEESHFEEKKNNDNSSENCQCYKLRKFLKKANVLRCKGSTQKWYAIKFRKNEYQSFVSSLKKQLKYFSKQDEMILNPITIYNCMLTTQKAITMLKDAKQYCFGCDEYCPLCKVKCQKGRNHGRCQSNDKHCSDFHFLQAFNLVTMNKNTGIGNNSKLCIDVCNSRMNQNKKIKWRYQEWSWIRKLFKPKNWQQIKLCYNSWDFGDNSSLSYHDIRLMLVNF